MKKKTEVFSKKPVWFLTMIILLIVLVSSIVFAVAMGSMEISASDIFRVVIYKLFGIGDGTVYGKGAMPDVVWFIRLPRLILAVAVGMGLAVCGTVMQAIVKNPLADPYILGVSSGASLGATLAIMLGIGSIFGGNFVGVMGFLGAFGVSIMVMLISNIGGRSNSVKLLLSGMALSSVCSAFSSFIVYFSNDKEGIKNITYWLMGSLAGAKWESIAVVFPFVIICSIFLWTQYRTLNLMLLGDEASITLGTDLNKYRHMYLLVCSLMIGFIVYTSGTIGFVGLIVPHIVRSVFGTNHKMLLPLSALLGAILMVWADVLCRIVIPNTEIPIGILISMIGAPCFVYMMIKKSYGFGGNNQ
ncbi:iron complex transport system permease protein [Hathewaya proteolytica DSM 3090]|uniref:Iron complex transport system permease protein n=1 Tax=Hathewaya proteolytica DSM 3090 TaxID=1121331 RepID=A0A1M6K9S3_9CLOT|nr:iron ABC transporter permease [Hathewaya proteolytica]SHJ55650.1 iron complex transport system permease protein [Hathewaya proteolytica DSM 3090]